MIAFGLLTRWAIIAQLPILIGAIVVNFMGKMKSKNLLWALQILGAVYKIKSGKVEMKKHG